VELHINTEGKVSVLQSAVPGSQALHEIWKKIITESLGIGGEEIDFPVNTGNILDSGPSTLSRSIVIITKLVESCCELIKKKRFRSPLPLSAAKSFRLSRTNPWNDQAFSGDPFLALSWAVSIVELKIDPLTFTPEIEGIWLVVDGGQILNESEARKTLEIEIGQALGWTILEKIDFVKGAIPHNRFAGYRIPSTADSPSPNILFFDAGGKRQVKGIGELALSCFPAAYVKALSQAVGVPITEIPVRLEDLGHPGEQGS
jgi:CO/xanthine dehydrogenase Mo-binding subunit